MARTEYIDSLRKEVFEEPEEVHLGGIVNKKSAFMKQMEALENEEQS